MVASWVDESWKELPCDVVERSFIQCGSTLRNEGGFDLLHSKLKPLMADETATCEERLVDDEPSGLTDQDGDDDEEYEEVETD